MMSDKINDLIESHGLGHLKDNRRQIEQLIKSVIEECIFALDVDPRMSGTNELACSGSSQQAIKRYFRQ